MKRPPSCLIKEQRGTATLELAIILPFLFSLAFGIFEFGNIIYKRHLISVGVRDAARYIASVPFDGTTQATVEAAAKNIATNGITSGGTARVVGWIPANVSVSYTDITNDDGSGNKIYRGGASIKVVTVSTTFAYQNIGFLGYLGLGAITLSPSHEERYYGVR